MFASRASADRPLTPRATILSSGATWLYQSWLARDLRWVMAAGLVYALAVVAATLSLNRYFSQTWDVMTFAAAARNFLPGGDWQALYAQTRIAQQWPYAYPPFHAAVIAPLLLLSGLVPEWLLVRVPPLLADIGVGALIYTIIARKTNDRTLARLGIAVWLFNPVTFYDTAVQGHFEAEWLFFVLLGYMLAGSRRGLVMASLSFAVAFLFKQIAIILILPYWVNLVLETQPKATASSGVSDGVSELKTNKRIRRLSIRLFVQDSLTPFLMQFPYMRTALFKRGARLVVSGLVFVIPVLLISFPFLLYSGDYIYMNLNYVAEVPLQTQSWLVLLHGWIENDFWLLQHSTLLVALAALIISLIAQRRGFSPYRIALLIVIAFFLLSQKVMGYYYAMLIPFALVELIPARRFGLLTGVIAAMAWISLSPYFASWAQPAHWPWYAALGTVNSLFWAGIAVTVWGMDSESVGWARDSVGEPRLEQEPPRRKERKGFYINFSLRPLRLRGSFSDGSLILFSALLFFEMTTAALVQPLVNSTASPIRAPLISTGSESNAFTAFCILAVATIAGLGVAWFFTRRFAPLSRISKLAFLSPLVYLALYFLTFTLTKESTAAFELLLKSLGL